MTARKRAAKTADEATADSGEPKAKKGSQNPYVLHTAAWHAWENYPHTRKGAQAPEE